MIEKTWGMWKCAWTIRMLVLRHRLAVLLGLVVTGHGAWFALGCSVPVFRYALERWEPDAYEAVVFHREPLTPDQQGLVDALGKVSRDSVANLSVEVVNLSGTVSEAMGKLWQSQSNEAAPRLILKYPASRESTRPIWGAGLSAESVRTMLDSPARRELARRLTEGATAVWLFLETGQKARDDSVASLLDRESRRLEKAVKLPEPSPDDPPLRSTQAVKVAFQTVRVPRTGAAESVLRDMLLGADGELVASAEPMVFAVFGRGRALPALVGREISDAILEEAARFLASACSCQVKAMNPGFDLLLRADWDSAFEDRLSKPAELPPLIGVSTFAAAAVEVPAATTTNAAPVASQRGRLLPNLLFVFGVGIVALIVATLAIKARLRAPRE